MSDTSDVTLQEDGVITYSDESRCVFEILATRAPSRCGSKVQTDEVALAFLACPDGKETTEDFWDYVAWAVKRTRWTPRPLCPYEAEDIRETGVLPEVLPEVKFTANNNVTICPKGMLPILMPLAADLQKKLDQPVEWHHVFYALVKATTQALQANGREPDSVIPFGVLEEILVEHVREHGHLPHFDSVSDMADLDEPSSFENNSPEVSDTDHPAD